MNTLFFKYALEVERTGSITQAAENLFIAQPNLSKAIKEAENSMGFPIFERTSRGVTPTAKGTVFLSYAKEIASRLDQIEAIGDEYDDHISHLSISVPRSAYIAEAFLRFAKELDPLEAVDLTIKETNALQTVSDVLSEKFNFGIIRYRTSHEQYFQDYLFDKGLSSTFICQFDCYILFAKDHPLAEAKLIRQDALFNSIELIRADTFIPYMPPEKAKQAFSMHTGKRIQVYDRADQLELLSCLPSSFMLSPPLPQGVLDRYGLSQRKYSPSPENTYKDMLIFLPRYIFSELDNKFISALHRMRDEISNN